MSADPQPLAAWVAARQPAPPAGLARALEGAIGAAPDAGAPAAAPRDAASRDAAPGQLADAGLAALRRGLALGDARPAAYELLAADALLTYAIERAAVEGVESLSALLDELAPAAFAPLAGAEP